MRTHQFYKFWLKITSITIVAFGPIFFLGSMQGYSAAASLSLDILSWPLDGLQNFNAPTTRFLSALTGGFLFGWGIMVWLLSIWVYDKAPEQVRKTVLFGILAWFIVDSLGSILSGNKSNAFFNVLVLITAVGPLWFPINENPK